MNLRIDLMTYKVYFSDKSREDLSNIHFYISVIENLPDTADRFIDRLVEACDSLSFMPERFKKVGLDIVGLEEIRIYPIKRYLIFYLVNKDNNRVEIIRVISSAQNYKNLL